MIAEKDLIKKNIFYVTGRHSFDKCGVKKYITKNISCGEPITRFYNFSPNPNLSDVAKGISQFKNGKYDCIVAAGGGSVIDMGKLIAYFLEHSIDKFPSSETSHSKELCPVIAIPTTAGSGSEATHFAVVYHQKKKYSIAHAGLKPALAILNPKFSFRCSLSQKIPSALDAFCQSIESYWSKGANSISKKHAFKALSLLTNNLESGIAGNDYEAFEKVFLASNYAGKAIDISKTTACHALSYHLTSKYSIPHGKAVAMLMPYVFDYHARHLRDSLAIKDIINILGFDRKCLHRDFKNFYHRIGFHDNLETLGISLDAIGDELSENVNQERLQNNPIKIDISQLFNS